MKPHILITELDRNYSVFSGLLSGLPEDLYRWRPSPDKWCLLEILCHLIDEEKEDFRARVLHTLENPQLPMPPINPTGWVKERNYMGQDYASMLSEFLLEREHSVNWLHGLRNPAWDQAYQHPKLGPMSARLFLHNWLAHDYLHIRQINRLKFAYLKAHSDISLDYAGAW